MILYKILTGPHSLYCTGGMSLPDTWSDRHGEEEDLTPEQNRNLVTQPVASYRAVLKLKTIS